MLPTLRLNAIKAIYLAGLLCLSQPAQAMDVEIAADPGVGRHTVTITEMQVQILGHDIKLIRQHKGGWRFFPAWQALDFGDKVYLGYPKLITRSRVHYELNTGSELAQGGTPVWTNSDNPQKQITATKSGYHWQNLDGEWIAYNSEGYPQRIGDRYGHKLTLRYNSDKQLIAVDDVNDRRIFTLTRNDAGQIISITDLAGRTVTYTWEGGLLTKAKDIRGKIWQYSYWEDRIPENIDAPAMTAMTDPLGRITRFNYTLFAGGSTQSCPSGSQFVLQQSVNPQTGTVTFRREQVPSEGGCYLVMAPPQFRLTGIVHPGGATTEYEFYYNKDLDQYMLATTYPDGTFEQTYTSSEGVVLAEVTNGEAGQVNIKTPEKDVEFDIEGRATAYHKNAKAQVTRIDYPDGSSLQYQYHPVWGEITQMIDERGIITRHIWNDEGKLSKTIEAAGTPAERIIEYQRNPLGQPTLIRYVGDTRTPAAEYRYSYDNDGNLLSITDPAGTITTYSDYDVIGNYHSKKDANGHTTQYDYSVAGQLLSLTSAEGHTTTWIYDAAGQHISTKKPGIEEPATRAYDPRGRLNSLTNPEGHTVHLNYNARGQIIQTTDAADHSFTLGYGPQDKLTTIQDPAGNTIRYRYTDATGHPSSKPVTIATPAYVEQRAYDARHRLVKSIKTDPDGKLPKQIQTYTYDPAGNRLSATDALGRTTKYAYDALNRLIKVTDPTGGITRYTWDDRGNLISVTDPAGSTTTYVYNPRNQLIEEHRPAGQVWQYAYDAVGNQITLTRPNGTQVHYAYNTVNRLITESYYAQGATAPVSQTHYTWHPVGWLKSYTSNSTSGQFTYNGAGRLLSETTDFGPFSKTQRYTWTEDGLKQSITTPEGRTYQYRYTDNHLFQGLSLPDTGAITATGHNWRTTTGLQYPGGSQWQQHYDAFMRLTGQTLTDPAGTVLAKQNYSYNQVNNITGITRSRRAQGELNATPSQYGYDALMRLTQVTKATTTSESYTYDPVGNRLTGPQSQTHSYNVNHALLTTQAEQTRKTYSYNENGALIQKQHKTGDTVTATWQYRYNLQNRLSQVTKDTATIATYAYDPFGRRTKKTTNSATTYFLYNGTGLVAEYDANGQLLTEYHYKPGSPWGTNPLFLRTNNTVHYYINDQLGTPQMLINAAGQVTWQASYTAFGKATLQTQTIHQPLRFPGQYFDAETGLHYNYFRYYDPQAGRYIKSDPIGLEGGINTYAYVVGNPINAIDPSGLNCLAFNGTVSCIVPGGGPIVTFPRPQGWPAIMNANDLSYHNYNIPVPLNGADKECVMQGIINNPTPGSPLPATAGGTVNNATPSTLQSAMNFTDYASSFGNDYGGYNNSPVRSYVLNDGSVVVNVTMPGHPLHPGYVARYMDNGQVNNRGEGTSLWQNQYNPLSGPINGVWDSQTNEIIDNCGCQ